VAQFITELEVGDLSDSIWMLKEPLLYESDLIGPVVVPAWFQTDFASVPRIPFVFTAWGNRAHREAVIHDFLYRIDSQPLVTRVVADKVFLEAMIVREKSAKIFWPMYQGVRLCGWTAYHKRRVGDSL
jgi:hypothetical protein